jgi:hypothetical protein
VRTPFSRGPSGKIFLSSWILRLLVQYFYIL